MDRDQPRVLPDGGAVVQGEMRFLGYSTRWTQIRVSAGRSFLLDGEPRTLYDSEYDAQLCYHGSPVARLSKHRHFEPVLEWRSLEDFDEFRETSLRWAREFGDSAHKYRLGYIDSGENPVRIDDVVCDEATDASRGEKAHARHVDDFDVSEDDDDDYDDYYDDDDDVVLSPKRAFSSTVGLLYYMCEASSRAVATVHVSDKLTNVLEQRLGL